jgi:hypothetical protein
MCQTVETTSAKRLSAAPISTRAGAPEITMSTAVSDV